MTDVVVRDLLYLVAAVLFMLGLKGLTRPRTEINLSKNISTFLLNLVTDGKLQFDLDDEIVQDTMLTRNGEVLNARVRELLEMEPLEPAPHTAEETGDAPSDQPDASEETE